MWPSMTGGSTDPMGDAIKKLDDSAEKLGKAADALERFGKDAWAGLKSGGGRGGGGGAGPRPWGGRTSRHERDEGHGRDRGFSGRAFDMTRLGRAYHQAEGTAGRLAGGRGPSGMGGLGRVGGAVSRLAGVAGVVVAGVQALNEFRKAVIAASDAALAAQRKYAETSAAMSQVFMEKDFRDMMREMKTGNQLAPSARRLAEAESRRNDAGQPMETIIGHFRNELLAWLNDKIAPGLDVCSNVAKRVYKWIEGKEWKDEAGDPEFDRMLAASVLEGAKLDGLRLADLAEKIAGRVIPAPAGFAGAAAPIGRLP